MIKIQTLHVYLCLLNLLLCNYPPYQTGCRVNSIIIEHISHHAAKVQPGKMRMS